MEVFVNTQIQVLIQDIRLLEIFVTSPLGLRSDLEMLRLDLDLPEAANLSKEENERWRLVHGSLNENPSAVAHRTIEQIRVTLDIIESIMGRKDDFLNTNWIARARQVLKKVEQSIAKELRSDISSKLRGLYVIVDPEVTRGRPVLEVAKAILDGGATVVQLRDKINHVEKVRKLACKLKSMCLEYGALFIVNDDPGVAFLSRANGLHLGQMDTPPLEARRLLETCQILGVSNNNMDEISHSISQDVDYLAVGAIFGTTTMGKDKRPVLGVDAIRIAKDMVSQPIVAIGGIDQDNVSDVIRAGADCICVVSAVTLANDPGVAVNNLLEAIHNAK